MKNPFVQKALKDFLTNQGNNVLETYCASRHPGQVAEFLHSLPSEKDIWEILSLLSAELRAEIFSNLQETEQLEICTQLSKTELVELLTNMSSDDRVSLLKKDDNLYESVMPALAQAERDNIRLLYHFEEGCAGSFMTSEYATIPAEINVAAALKKLRLEAPNKETIYCAYIIDNKRKLVGYISLKDLVLAAPDTYIGAIMHREIIYIKAHESRKEAVQKIARYDLIALPVLSENDELLGIITHDDALDILNKEHTENMEKFMGIRIGTGDYVNTSVWQHFKSRCGWVIGLGACGLISGAILHHFEATIEKLTILILYIPMLTDTGGNTSCQSAAVIIRSLSLREISFSNFGKIVRKELLIGLLLALTMGLFTILVFGILSSKTVLPDNFELKMIGSAIAVALSLQVLISTLTGAILPLLAAKKGYDPALVSSPAITTIVDITGLLLYFYTVTWILGI